MDEDFVALSLIYPVLAVLVALLLLLCFLLLWKQKSRIEQLEKAQQETSQQLRQHIQLIGVVEEAVHEVRSGMLGMGNKVKELNLAYEHTQTKMEDLANLDPDSRLYTKATKLVQSGAGVEDLMRECELPRAEAELLYALHNQNIS